MKLLLVDDEYSKAQEISNLLSQSGISGIDITHETTAYSARQRLRSTSYDMLLIDLNLPDSVGAVPSQEGGINLFDLISVDELAKLPIDILFITAREDLVDHLETKALERGAILCQCLANSDRWKKILIGRVKNACRRLAREIPQSRQVDVAIVTALRVPELEAVLKLPYFWETSRIPGDPTTLHFGRLSLPRREISLVAASAHRKGMPSSAALSTKLSMEFRPKFLIMLGICAGIERKAKLGDIVIADPAWDWGSGKRGEDPEGSPVFLAAPHQMPLNTIISQLASELSGDSTVMGAIRAGWTGEVPQGVLKACVGPMASGASVIADEFTAQAISNQHRELVGVEMEAYAVMAAAEYSAEPKPKAIAIKSICDYADSQKNDQWQSYAAYTSAAFADQLLRKIDFSMNP